MHFCSKISVVLLAALAAASNATLLGPRVRTGRLAGRALNSTVDVASTVLVTPHPMDTSSAPAATPSSQLSVVSTEGAGPSQAETSSSDLTVTYTLGAGTSTSVVTTIIHRALLQPQTVTASLVPSAANPTTTIHTTSTITISLIPGPSASAAISSAPLAAAASAGWASVPAAVLSAVSVTSGALGSSRRKPLKSDSSLVSGNGDSDTCIQEIVVVTATVTVSTTAGASSSQLGGYTTRYTTVRVTSATTSVATLTATNPVSSGRAPDGNSTASYSSNRSHNMTSGFLTSKRASTTSARYL